MKKLIIDKKGTATYRFFETKIVIVLVTYLISMCSVNAQLLVPQLPNYGETGVSRLPAIQLQTSNQNYHIVASSVNNYTPYCGSNNSCEPSVLVVPQWVYSTLPDSVWRVYGSNGTISMPNSHSLKVQIDTSGRLNYYTSYAVVINKVKIVTAPGDTSICSISLPNYFKTVRRPPVFESSDIDVNSGVMCNQPLHIKFTSPIPSTETATGSIISLKKITGSYEYDTINHYLNTVIEPVPISLSLSEDSMTVTALPSSLQSGVEYVLNVDAGSITGDSINNHAIQFVVKKSAAINVRVQNITPLQSDPPVLAQPLCGEGIHYLQSGESLTMDVPKFSNDYEFFMWHSPNNSSIHGSTNPSLTVGLSCSELNDFTITAMYRKITIDTIKITNLNPELNGGTYRIYGFRDSLGNNTYTMNRKQGGDIFLNAVSSPTASFSYWSGGLYPNINPKMPLIVLRPRFDLMPIGRKFDIGIGFDDPLTPSDVQCNEFKFCIIFHKDFENEKEKRDFTAALSTIASGNFGIVFNDNGETMEGCISFPTPPDTRTFTAILNIIPGYEHCYEIAFCRIGSNNQTIGEPKGKGLGNSYTQPLTLTNPGKFCEEVLHVYIRKKKFTLRVETLAANNGYLPYNFAQTTYIKTSTTPPGEFKGTIRDEITDANGIKRLRKVTQIYQYNCDDYAIVFPVIENSTGYTLGEWVCPDGDPANADLYCSVDGSASQPQTLKMIMNEDRRAKYIFGVNFSLEEIGVFTRTGSIEWKSANQFSLQNGYKPVGFMYKNIPDRVKQLPPSKDFDPLEKLHRTYTSYFFKFNMSVDITTINGSIKFEDIESSRPSRVNGAVIGQRRFDAKPNRKYVATTGYNIIFHDYVNANGITIENGVVEFELKDEKGDYTCHLNKLKFFLLNTIKSVDNAPLSNPIMNAGITTCTGYPGFYMYIRDVRKFREYDNCAFSNRPDVRPHTLSTVLEPSNSVTGQYPTLSAYEKWDVKEDMYSFSVYDLNKPLLANSVSYLNELSQPTFAIEVIDEGTAEALDDEKGAEFINALATAAGSLVTDPTLKTLITFVASSMTSGFLGCDDRSMASGSISGTQSTLWSPEIGASNWLYGQPFSTNTRPLGPELRYSNGVFEWNIGEKNEVYVRFQWLLGDM